MEQDRVRRSGVLVDWNDQRGFGFLDSGGTRTFVHISAFHPSGGRPQAGDLVEYAIGVGPDGRRHAVGVTRAADRVGRRRGRVDALAFLPVVILAVLVVVVITVLNAPVWCAAFYLAMSAVAFGLYARDKRAAVEGGWRTPETTLQLVALLGGWPGAVLAQQVLRHKNRKASFQVTFWLAALANVVAFLVLTAAPSLPALYPG